MAISQFSYGSISLGLILSDIWARETIYDQHMNYLHTRHVFKVRGIYSPQPAIPQNSSVVTASFALDVPQEGTVGGDLPINTPNQARGNVNAPGVWTDEAIRHLLSIPRQQLIVLVGTKMALFSPRQGSVQDANQGPTPLSINVIQVRGTHSFLVEFTIETCVNENYLFANTIAGLGNTVLTTNPAVTSVTAETRTELDPDFYTTRYVHQVAKINVDQMIRNGHRAEQYIESLAPTISPGFKREKATVTIAPDETTMVWDVVDRETALQFLATNGASRIEAYQTESVGLLGAERAFWDIQDIGAQAALRAAELAVFAGEDPGRLAAALAAAGIQAGMALSQMIRNHLPTRKTDIIVRIWGSKNSRRDILTQLAIAVVLQRLGGAILATVRSLAGGFNASATQDLNGKFVEIKFTLNASPIVGAVTAVTDLLFRSQSAGFPTGPGSDATPGVLNDDAIAPAAFNPLPPGGFVTGLNPVTQNPNPPQPTGTKYNRPVSPPPARGTQIVVPE